MSVDVAAVKRKASTIGSLVFIIIDVFLQKMKKLISTYSQVESSQQSCGIYCNRNLKIASRLFSNTSNSQQNTITVVSPKTGSKYV